MNRSPVRCGFRAGARAIRYVWLEHWIYRREPSCLSRYVAGVPFVYFDCMWELWTLNIFKIAKFESDTSEASDDISPQSCEFRSLYGEAHATFRSSIFESFQPITFKVSNFTNLKAFFLAEFKDFSPFVHAIKWKKKKFLGTVYCCACDEMWYQRSEVNSLK